MDVKFHWLIKLLTHLDVTIKQTILDLCKLSISNFYCRLSSLRLDKRDIPVNLYTKIHLRKSCYIETAANNEEKKMRAIFLYRSAELFLT